MSPRPGAHRQPRSRVQLLVGAAREYSTAAVMLHAVVAERTGIGLVELKALDILQRLGMQTAGEMADVTGLKPSSVTSLVDRLHRRGWVTRRRDPQDRRRVLIRPTLKLERAIAPLFAGVNRRMRTHFRQYGVVQADLIGECLRRAAQDLREETSRIGRPNHWIHKRLARRPGPAA